MDNNSLNGNETQAKLEASEKRDTFAFQSDTSQQNIPKKEERGNVSSDSFGLVSLTLMYPSGVYPNLAFFIFILFETSFKCTTKRALLVFA